MAARHFRRKAAGPIVPGFISTDSFEKTRHDPRRPFGHRD